jgi:colicin import membrane protein
VSSQGHTLNYSAGAFSVLVHAAFMLMLVFGISWRTQPVGPAVAYLWDALPPMPKLALPEAAPPTPAPEKIEPVPKPAPPPPPKAAEPPRPDIALRDKEIERARQEEARKLEAERRLEEQRRKDEEKRREEERRRLEEKKQLEEKRRQEERQRHEEQRRQETQRELEEEQKALQQQRQRQREEARQQMERELARQMADDLAVERNQMRLQAEAVARGKMVLDYQDKIRLKIRGLLRLPPLAKGNIEVVFRVNLLPTGEVNGRPTLVKSSGVPAYDSAVERAIVGASPLPLPPDKEAAALFGEGLELKFRPYED